MDQPVKYRIKELPEETRPRERLQKLGAQSLHERELLAILLRTGTGRENALQLADRILQYTEGVQGLKDISLQELTGLHGIGPGKAASVLAGIELGRRAHEVCMQETISVSDPQTVADHFTGHMRTLKKEEFWILLVDVKCKMIHKQQISVGTINQSLIHPREVFEPAIRRSARGIIFVHNHPSGDPLPSQEDLAVTRRLTEVGQVMGIDVLDHLIIGRHDFYSLRQNGDM